MDADRLRLVLRAVVVMATVACSRTSLPADDNRSSALVGFAAWQRQEHLLVMNDSRAETLVDFPVLVHLDASHIDYAATRADGADLRFVDADGRLLDHEV